MQLNVKTQVPASWPKRVALTSAHKDLLDRFQRELDASERIAPMHNSYRRISPYIVELAQAGHTYNLIVYHVESELWYAREHWFDSSFQMLYDARLIRKGDVIFDLGCNSGAMTCWYAMETGPTGHVHAFDPFPWNAIATRYSAELNNLRNVTVHQVGIGAESGEIDLSLYDAKITSRQGPHVIKAMVHPLSEYVHLEPNVLKIDIEGAEYELSHTDFDEFKQLRLCYLELHTWFIEDRGLKSETCLRNFMRHGFELRRAPNDSKVYDGSAVQRDDHGGYFLTRAVAPTKRGTQGSLIRKTFHKLAVPVQAPIRLLAAPLRRRRLVQQLTAALVERDSAIRYREARVKEREAVIREREAVIREREAMIRECEAMIREREAMIRELQGQLELTQCLDFGERHGIFGEIGNLPLDEAIRKSISELEGWCTIRKAKMLSDLIQSNDCKSALEVGIYGGRSLIPMALTMRHLGRGYVIGIDPWCNKEATKSAISPENDRWWSDVDLAAIKRSYLVGVLKFRVPAFVKILELNSEQAWAALSGRTFDLIHIDGSHAEEQAYRDVVNWSKLMDRGNILVLDSINWESIRKARSWIRGNFDLIEEGADEDSAYGAYRKR